MMTRVRYTVDSVGNPFPLDMLRYDESTFSTEEAAKRAEWSILTEGERNLVVELHRDFCTLADARDFKARLRSAERWASFGWSVTSLSI